MHIIPLPLLRKTAIAAMSVGAMSTLLLSGCISQSGSAVLRKAYEGAERPNSEIATLHATCPAIISKVDDAVGPCKMKRFPGFISLRAFVDTFDGHTLQLLPGPHTIVMNFKAGVTESTKGATFQVSLEAGKTYEITASYTADERHRNMIGLYGPTSYGKVYYFLREGNGAIVPMQVDRR